MDEPTPSPLPSHVRHADGSLEPFDADRLHHTLYRATELHGQADSFLSQELTDSILPFLAERMDKDAIAAMEISEVAAAVLRELGHVQLVQPFLEAALRDKERRSSPDAPAPEADTSFAQTIRQQLPLQAHAWQLAQQAAQKFSLEEVYPSHITAAHQEGLLTLGQLSAPRELASLVVRWPESGVLSFLGQYRQFVGQELVFDSPDRERALLQTSPEQTPALLREAALASRWAGLRLALHLNCQPPPAWARAADPPLFPSHVAEQEERLSFLSEQFLLLSEEFPDVVRLAWHFSENQTQDADFPATISRLSACVRKGAAVSLHGDQPRRGCHLQDGHDRHRLSLLQTIELHLDVLARRQQPNISSVTFAGKTLSLARLALSAAKVRRDFIRRCRLPGWPGFLLDQAHVCLRLCGVESAAAVMSDDMDALALHQALAQRLPSTVARDAMSLNLSAILEPVQASGPNSDLSAQVSQAAGIHALWGQGVLQLPTAGHSFDELPQCLRGATGLAQVSFLPEAPRLQQS